MAILNNYKQWNNILTPYRSEYWDMVLTPDGTTGPINGSGITKRCLISFIDTDNPACLFENGLKSDLAYKWEDGKNESETLKDIGLTGIDNGFISYDKYSITNLEFLKILTQSEYWLGERNLGLVLNKVGSNSQYYDLSMSEEVEDNIRYYALKGGFFQGFYKLFGFDYQVLPQYIENEWTMDFVLRPMEYEESDSTLNAYNENRNKGIFFYMGTRAENKFAQFYDSGIEKYPQRVQTGCSASDIEVDEAMKGLIEEDVKIDCAHVTTSDGKELKDAGYYEIPTDNKFLTFNCTENGFTVDTYDEDVQVVLTGSTRGYWGKYEFKYGHLSGYTDNLHLLMHCAENGYNVDTVWKLLKSGSNKYNLEKDILNNCFALRINEKGQVGYKFLVKDCDSEAGWKIEEEYSIATVKTGKWHTITARFKILNGGLNKCKVPNGQRRMKIYIYIDGFLKLVSRELPEFNFRELNDTFDKQEGVPFNISLGGGSQGLCDSIWLDYLHVLPYILPIEQNFAGTFIGDIKEYRFYECGLELQEIRNNVKIIRKTI